jgi:biotin transport system substrate-specific component
VRSNRIQYAVAVALLAIGAQVSVSVPGTPVPQSLQTLAVVLVGGWLGPARGVVAVVVYVCLGAAGLPVFAEGASGAEHLVGATSGYLLGFVVAAGVRGWWVLSGGRDPFGFVRCAVGAVVAHAIILALGWARLAVLVGPAEAWAQGVEPFVLGGILKAIVAAAILALVVGRLVAASDGGAAASESGAAASDVADPSGGAAGGQ